MRTEIDVRRQAAIPVHTMWYLSSYLQEADLFHMPLLQSEHIRIVTDLSPCGDYVFQYRNPLFASFLNFFEEIRKCGLRVFSR